MSDNPFQSPSTTEQVVTHESTRVSGKWEVPSSRVIGVVFLLAALTGVAFWGLAGGAFAEWILVPVIYFCPAIAILLVSIASAWSRKIPAPAIRRGVGLFFLTGLASVAGYISFATTCCCVNALAVGPQSYMPPPTYGSIVTFFSVLTGVIVVYLLHRLARSVWGTDAAVDSP